MILEDERWVLPEGVEEVLPPGAARLEAMRRRVLDQFRTWGYELVIPPFIEYLDSLLTGTGSDLDLQTFKLIDQLTGRLMGVRADMTPQAARIDAHHLERDEPVRLCYLGTVLHTLPDGVSGSRSPIQVGAELYGHGGLESDCEVICLMLETLAAAGVRDVHLDLGHVGVYRALTRTAGLSEQQEALLNDALQRKAQAELTALIGTFGLRREHARMLRMLADLNGGCEVLARARETLTPAGDEVLAEVSALEVLMALVRDRAPAVPMHFDLAELRGYRYHTGVVFAAFVPGHGQEIARGGRYDEIGKDFGSARPATGFSTDLKTLSALCAGDGPREPPGGILAPWSSDPALLARVRELRRAGERVVCELPGQAGAAGCDRALRLGKDGWEIVPVAQGRMPSSGAQLP